LALSEKENVAMKSLLRIGLFCLFSIQLGLIGFAQSGTIITLAGTGSPGYNGDGGAANLAQLNTPYGVVVDAAGNLFIADGANHRIRKISSSGVITTVAGNGSSGYSGDGGPAISAQLSNPFGIAVDSSGNLFIADTYNHCIREVSSSTGVIATVAGTGSFGFSGDGGAATSAQLRNPFGVAVDAVGNLFIADTDNNRIRKVSSGTITTVAGTGSFGFSGDSGLATSAQLNWPNGIAVDSAGNFYIGDTSNNRIRKVTALGVINTIAGNSGSVYNGDNIAATSAGLSVPTGIAVDVAGNLFIADQYHSRIRKVSSGIITTIAGTGSYGYTGDSGAATSAQINFPYSVAVDSTGDIFIADSNNHRIREVTTSIPPSVSAYFPQVAIGGGWSTSFTLNNTGSATVSGDLILVDYQGNPFTVNISTLGLGSSFPISIPAGGTMFLTANPVSPNDPRKIGWAKVETSNGSLNGVATYQSVLEGVIQTATGVLSSLPTQYATIPVDENYSQNRKVAYALANQSSQILTIKVALVDLNGIVVNDTVSITLNPGQQMASYFNQNFPNRPTFQGSIVLRAQGGGAFIIVGLIQNEEQFYTAIPVIPSKAAVIPN
jgi:hypothetical protein